METGVFLQLIFLFLSGLCTLVVSLFKTLVTQQSTKRITQRTYSNKIVL